MAEVAATVKKRWRAWLRAAHRDIGYLAVGFTLIYAVSGIAMNHIGDWDPNYTASERQLQIAPVPDTATDAEAAKLVALATGFTGTPTDVFRAGDEVRLEFSDGSKVTAIGSTATVQKYDPRFMIRVATWLHATRGKAVWKYIADIYALLLLYLSVSGLFMLKGRLGMRWRGAVLVAIGLAVPLGYIVFSGGPDGNKAAKIAAPGPGATPEPGAPLAPGS